ncbi:MAG: 3-keto-disaccharide hydrolase [Candidatus Rokuibacteriota bacterium]
MLEEQTVQRGGDYASAGARAAGAFRFAVGEQVRVITHPARPLVTVTARWRGQAFEDVYDQNIYAVSGFVTRQREPNLAGDGFVSLSLEASSDWQMTGRGTFRRVGPDTVESEGGPGIWWYTRKRFADFVLFVDWRVSRSEDNSGVFVRIPALGSDDPENDWRPAVAEGYEIQIDERGVDPATGRSGSARHLTGAVYALAPAHLVEALPPGCWRCFGIEACGDRIEVRLNGVVVSTLVGGTRSHAGYVGLQVHHPGARVRFRNLQIMPL